MDEKVDWGKRQKAREADAKRYWPQQLGRLIKRAAIQNREIATLKKVFFSSLLAKYMHSVIFFFFQGIFFFTFHVDE